MKDIALTLKAERELTDKEAEKLEKTIARCLTTFGLEEWHLEVEHEYKEYPLCKS